MNFRILLTSLILFSVCAFGQGAMTTEQIYQEAYENFVKRDYTSASASLDKINPVDQKKPDILNLRGAIYKRLGELDNAANAYSDALKVNPKDWVPKYNLAEVNFLREQYKLSRTFLEQALASMPEADRLQKQDLILYKVYLTYLLQGEEEKAKLLLDSFDMNSANPVYYFAQAAWSYKKKDTAKAKTWIDSTDGLYSQDLRNSYSQSLVDVGWLEPLAGVTTAAVAAATSPSPTAENTVAAASPSATGDAVEMVPLSTNNATPIAMAANSPSATPEMSASVTPDLVAATPAAGNENAEPAKTEFWKILLPVILVLGLAAIILMNLAKRSRMVPAPVDNTGYAAIAASSNPEDSELSSHQSEGTGVVRVQESDEAPAPAPIKVVPIHREYAADQAAAAEKTVVPQAPAPRITRRVQTSAAPATVRKPAAKPAAAASKVSPVSTARKAPAKTEAKLSSATPTKGKSLAGKSIKPQAAATEAKAPAKSSQAAPKTAEAPASSMASSATVATSSTSRTASAKKPKANAPASTSESSSAGKRTRLIPVPSINVPQTDEARKTRVLVSNIGKIVVPPAEAGSHSTARTDESATDAAPVEKTVTPPKKTPARKSAASKPANTPVRSETPKTASPLITIPEFEETDAEPQTRTVLRVLPNQPGDSGDNPPASA